MKCPHCHVAFHLPSADQGEYDIGEDGDGKWALLHMKCPSCERLIMVLVHGPVSIVSDGAGHQRQEIDSARAVETFVHPLGKARPLPPSVPERYASRFQEAVGVAPISPAASAALSRTLLQELLREVAKIKRRNLSDEIDALLDSNDLPSQLTEDVDAIRVVGNFAAHPIKSTATGQIVPVETGEAEWLMDVLEELFDFYFVRRDAREGRRDKLNQKLRDAGKPELRTGTDGQSVGRSI